MPTLFDKKWCINILNAFVMHAAAIFDWDSICVKQAECILHIQVLLTMSPEPKTGGRPVDSMIMNSQQGVIITAAALHIEIFFMNSNHV